MNVRWTDPALGDLREAYDYIAKDDPTAADAVLARILTAGDSLSSMPNRGRPARTRRLRELVLAPLPYILVYRVGNEEVVILRVWHGARRR